MAICRKSHCHFDFSMAIYHVLIVIYMNSFFMYLFMQRVPGAISGIFVMRRAATPNRHGFQSSKTRLACANSLLAIKVRDEGAHIGAPRHRVIGEHTHPPSRPHFRFPEFVTVFEHKAAFIAEEDGWVHCNVGDEHIQNGRRGCNLTKKGRIWPFWGQYGHLDGHLGGKMAILPILGFSGWPFAETPNLVL
jgi:hypothetical protein